MILIKLYFKRLYYTIKDIYIKWRNKQASFLVDIVIKDIGYLISDEGYIISGIIPTQIKTAKGYVQNTYIPSEASYGVIKTKRLEVMDYLQVENMIRNAYKFEKTWKTQEDITLADWIKLFPEDIFEISEGCFSDQEDYVIYTIPGIVSFQISKSIARVRFDPKDRNSNWENISGKLPRISYINIKLMNLKHELDTKEE